VRVSEVCGMWGGGGYDGLVDVPGGGQVGEEDGAHWYCWKVDVYVQEIGCLVSVER
jgi:hypothetical protein